MLVSGIYAYMYNLSDSVIYMIYNFPFFVNFIYKSLVFVAMMICILFPIPALLSQNMLQNLDLVEFKCQC